MTKDTQPRWDDLTAFAAIVAGLRAGKTLQQIAEDPSSGIGGARMLYHRLGRLEDALECRLVNRRRWKRTAHLTSAGEKVAKLTDDLSAIRSRIVDTVRGEDIPLLRIATHSTLVSSLIPDALRQQKPLPQNEQLFHLELNVVSRYAEAITAVNDDQADIALYLAFPQFDRIPTPRTMRREILGHTDVVLLCPKKHPFASRRRGRGKRPVTLEELKPESVIVRGYVDMQLLPRGSSGRRIIVTHSLDKIPYVRLGLGVSILPKLIADLIGIPRDVAVVPFRPTIRPALCLLRPKKRTRPLGNAVEEFLESVKKTVRGAITP